MNTERKISLTQIKENFPMDSFCVRTKGDLTQKSNFRRKGFIFQVDGYQDKGVVDKAGNIHLAKNIESFTDGENN